MGNDDLLPLQNRDQPESFPFASILQALGLLLLSGGMKMKTMTRRLRLLGKTTADAARAWISDQAMGQAAALSYYALFSIAPLLLIALAVSGYIFGAEASRDQIYQTFESLVGSEGARGVRSLVESASLNEEAGILATTVGVITLIIGATTVFAQLQDSLNHIWKVEARPGSGFRALIRQRVLSFSMVLVIAFLLLVSLILSAVIAGIGKYFSETLPGGVLLWQAAELAFSFGVTTVLFAALYKILPDVKLRWRDVWSGAFVTALFFTIGKFLIGLYLGKGSVTSAYGVGGSLVVFLIWSYYSSAIVLYGAEFTYARQKIHGTKLAPKPGAHWILPPKAQLPAGAVAAPSALPTKRSVAKPASKKPGKRSSEPPQVH